MDSSTWTRLPNDLVLRVLERVEDLETRRAFGIFGRLSPQQLSLQFVGKPIESGHMTPSVSYWCIRWTVGSSIYRLCSVFAHGDFRQVVCVRRDDAYDVVWSSEPGE
jgi:hypothetical protein